MIGALMSGLMDAELTMDSGAYDAPLYVLSATEMLKRQVFRSQLDSAQVNRGVRGETEPTGLRGHSTQRPCEGRGLVS